MRKTSGSTSRHKSIYASCLITLLLSISFLMLLNQIMMVMVMAKVRMTKARIILMINWWTMMLAIIVVVTVVVVVLCDVICTSFLPCFASLVLKISELRPALCKNFSRRRKRKTQRSGKLLMLNTGRIITCLTNMKKDTFICVLCAESKINDAFANIFANVTENCVDETILIAKFIQYQKSQLCNKTVPLEANSISIHYST